MLNRDDVNNMIIKFAKQTISINMIKQFTQDCYDILDTSVHFDDSFHDYIHGETGENTLTPPEADALDAIVDKMFDFCQKWGLDIHEIAGEIQQSEFKKRGIIPEESFIDEAMFVGENGELHKPDYEMDFAGETENDAYDKGKEAYYNDSEQINCPYDENDAPVMYDAWMEGWKDANTSEHHMKEGISLGFGTEDLTPGNEIISEDSQPIQNNKLRTDQEVKDNRNRINQEKAQMKKDHKTIDNAIGAQKVWQVDALQEDQNRIALNIQEHIKIKNVIDSALTPGKEYDFAYGKEYIIINEVCGNDVFITQVSECGGQKIITEDKDYLLKAIKVGMLKPSLINTIKKSKNTGLLDLKEDFNMYGDKIRWKNIGATGGKPCFYATVDGYELEVAYEHNAGVWVVYVGDDKLKETFESSMAATKFFENNDINQVVRELKNKNTNISDVNIAAGNDTLGKGKSLSGLVENRNQIKETTQVDAFMSMGSIGGDSGAFMNEEEDLAVECMPEVNKEYIITDKASGNSKTIKIVSICGDILRFRIKGLNAIDPRTTSKNKFCELMNAGTISEC